MPILLAATLAGVRGGLLAAAVAVVIYVPHAFLVAHGDHAHATSATVHADPATQTQKLLEMGFYLLVGGVGGALMERQHREQQRQAELAVELQASLRALRHKDRQLERAARLESLGQLTAGLAHEIRNPLHAMRGTAEILLESVPEGTEEHRLGSAHLDEIDRLSGLLGRFLDFAREKPAELGPVRLHDVAAHVRDLADAQARQQQTTLELEGEAPEVEADRDQIVQVVLGLVLNALQALERGGTVTLVAGRGLDQGRPGATLEVANDGPPIPEDLLDRLFDPFVSTRDDGTGLGLAQAWRIVETHGGRLEARNGSEGGVIFRLWLPA